VYCSFHIHFSTRMLANALYNQTFMKTIAQYFMMVLFSVVSLCLHHF